MSNFKEIPLSILCHICKKEVSGSHSCSRCSRYVHLICGKPVGEEVYGQKVVCFSCENGKPNFSRSYFFVLENIATHL